MALVRSPERSRFIQSLHNVKLDLDIVQTNILVKFHHNFICESWSMYQWSFMILGVSILELSSRNHFSKLSHRDLDSHCVNTFFGTVTLTFDLVTWKSIGVICQSWSMYLWSFMILGVSILELSSGNHFTFFESLWPWPLT